MSRVVIVTDHYWPDDISTGFFLTEIAEHLASEFEVVVICGAPVKPGATMEVRSRNGVMIQRVAAPGNKAGTLRDKAIRTFGFAAGAFWQLVRTLRRGDVVLSVTTPPLLPLAAALAGGLRRVPHAVIVHDVYPDVLVATGLLRHGSPVARLIDWSNRMICRAAKLVIVLGRDMRTRVAAWKSDDMIDVIPHWPDIDLTNLPTRQTNSVRGKLGLQQEFIVLTGGNFGKTHDVAVVLAAARRLSAERDVCFLFSGWGVGRRWLEDELKRAPLDNVRLVDRVERSELLDLLTAGDLVVVPFIPGMAGISVPSRLYNLLGAALPILAVADPSSELALVVGEEDAGWLVAPGDVEGVCSAILAARNDPEGLAHKGLRAQAAARQKYTREQALTRYADAVRALRSDAS